MFERWLAYTSAEPRDDYELNDKLWNKMLQRDYFIRIIEEFMAALGRFLEKKVDERTDEDLKELYRQYVGSYDVLRNLSFEEILRYADEQYRQEERLQRLNMLAELLYTEGSYKNAPLRDMLLNKAYKLFDYVEENGKEMSLTRRLKMREMREKYGIPTAEGVDK